MAFNLPFHDQGMAGPPAVCMYWQRGSCVYGDECPSHHGGTWVRREPTLAEAWSPAVRARREPLGEVEVSSRRTGDISFSPDGYEERVLISPCPRPPVTANDDGHDFQIWEDDWNDEGDEEGGETNEPQHLPDVTMTDPMDFEIWDDANGIIVASELREAEHDNEIPYSEEDTYDQGNTRFQSSESEGLYDQENEYVTSFRSPEFNFSDFEGQEEEGEAESPRSEVSNDTNQLFLASTRALASSTPPHRGSSSQTAYSPAAMNQTRDNSHNVETVTAGRGEGNNGPHPSFIQVANPYIFEQKLEDCLSALGASEHKEDSIRLQGVHWIDSVRKALQLPIRTFNTAVVYYHKFRLVHADNEYMFIDAAAAALFTACKIEDTLKKSREVLCAAFNMKVPMSDHLSPDDTLFDATSKTVVGLERLMLESAGFDFRNRHPQEIVVKLVRDMKFPKEPLGKTAYNMSIDIYRTFAPVKQTAQTMAIACIELSARLLNSTSGFDLESILGPNGIDPEKSSTTRAETMETILDLLDLYTHHRNATLLGPHFPIETFINTRISLNKESTSTSLPRHTHYPAPPQPQNGNNNSNNNKSTNGTTNNNNPSPQTAIATPDRPSATQTTPKSPAAGQQTPAIGPTSADGRKEGRVGERGKDGTVRFMLEAERARAEKEVVGGFFGADEWEEYEEEVEVPV